MLPQTLERSAGLFTLRTVRTSDAIPGAIVADASGTWIDTGTPEVQVAAGVAGKRRARQISTAVTPIVRQGTVEAAGVDKVSGITSQTCTSIGGTGVLFCV